MNPGRTNPMRTTLCVGILVAAALLAGCGKHEEKPAAQLTEHQRDSVLATEPIPGASVVGRAMQAAGAEERRADKLDSLAN